MREQDLHHLDIILFVLKGKWCNSPLLTTALSVVLWQIRLWQEKFKFKSLKPHDINIIVFHHLQGKYPILWYHYYKSSWDVEVDESNLLEEYWCCIPNGLRSQHGGTERKSHHKHSHHKDDTWKTYFYFIGGNQSPDVLLLWFHSH